MNRKFLQIVVLVTLLALLTAAVASAAAPTAAPASQSYIILSKTNRVPNSLVAAVNAAGGTVTDRIDKIGVVVASSSNAAFPSRIAALDGVEAIAPNVTFSYGEPTAREAIKNAGSPPYSDEDDFFFNLQWGHTAVDAVEAWQTRGRGDGVRVAVLDDGIDSDHPDLAPNLNVALSTSFVPDETFEYIENYPGDPFSHGTHVAGTIAAADNAYGTIGVAPEAEIVMVKVLSSLTGSGEFDYVVNGIIYAADIGADVINMSLGALIDANEIESADDALDVAAIVTALDRAGRYANQKGATLIASAGNDGLRNDRRDNLLHLPSDLPRYLSISATGPLGWGVDPSTDLDVPAYYTNYGNLIHYAAPGGNVDFGLLESGQVCTVAGITRPCYVFDFVFSTGSAGGWYWSAGTSMAAPHTSGVAAVIIGANGGDMNPGAVKLALKRTADDLGAPGKDAYYGWGRVNAANPLR